MVLKPLVTMCRKGQLPLLLRLSKDTKRLYRLCFVATAGKNGLLTALADGPVSFDRLAGEFCRDDDGAEALEAWLELGLHLGELTLGEDGYAACGYSKKLLQAGNDPVLAMIEETVFLHIPLILKTPTRLRQGEKWRLEDQDGEMIARSSRILEPFQIEAIDRFFPAGNPVRLLEVGCGSGIYVRYAARKNPGLSAVCVELQEEVAEMARRNFETWGLTLRAVVEHSDIRDKTPEASFDIVTLYNNIYYFPVDERLALLTHLLAFLKPGGMLLLTTCCKGGGPTTDVLNLWGAATSGCGGLPKSGELENQLQEAGFTGIRVKNLLPGESFYAFAAHRSAVC